MAPQMAQIIYQIATAFSLFKEKLYFCLTSIIRSVKIICRFLFCLCDAFLSGETRNAFVLYPLIAKIIVPLRPL